MVKANYIVALSNYHYIIIRPHLEKALVILCIRSMITNGMNLLMLYLRKMTVMFCLVLMKM